MDLYRRSGPAGQIEPVLVRVESGHGLLSGDAHRYVGDARAENTRRAYRSDLRAFTRWCADSKQLPLPASPLMVANYASFLAKSGRRVATIERAVAAISQAHLSAGFPSPRFDTTLKNVMTGIRRSLGVRPRKKRPVLVRDLRALIAATASGNKGTRDRALLALAFAAALRRSEVVALDVGDLTFTSEGLVVTVRRGKTDQKAVGADLGIPFGAHPESCPVRLIRAWLDTTAAADGPLFCAVNRHGRVSTRRLSAKAVATVLQQLAPQVGLEPTSLGAHSLRSGFITAAMRAGKPEHLVMRHSRHRSVTVFRGYVAAAGLFEDNAVAGIGL